MTESVLLLIFVLLVLIFIITIIQDSDTLHGYSRKGYSGEFFVNQMIKQNLDTNKYHLIENVTLSINGDTTQIDHIVVSEFGIFVIETKNKKGWIYGSSTQKQWTQNIFGNTYKFQNPLHQNYKHIKTLQRCLDIKGYYLISVIVFVGDSIFKSKMPVNITCKENFISFITSKTNVIIPKEKVPEIINKIHNMRLEPNFKTHEIHKENVRKIHNEYKQNYHPLCFKNFRKSTRMTRKLWKW